MGKENDKTPSRTEHEKLFSPSQWSKRLGPDEVRQNIDIIRSYAKHYNMWLILHLYIYITLNIRLLKSIFALLHRKVTVIE